MATLVHSKFVRLLSILIIAGSLGGIAMGISGGTMIASAYGKIMTSPLALGTFSVPNGGEFGADRSWILYPGATHKGIDLTPYNTATWLARAPADGWVVDAGYQREAGNYVVIYHSGYCNQVTGSCPAVFTKYLHLASVWLPSQSVSIKKGDVIGVVGSTGTATTGVHLHFEVRENSRWGSAVNPREYARFGDGRDRW